MADRLDPAALSQTSTPGDDLAHEVLFETSRHLGHPDHFKMALEVTLASLHHRHKMAATLLFTPHDSGELTLDQQIGISAELAGTLTASAGEGLIGVAWSSGQLRVLDDVATEASDPFIRQMIQRHSIQTALLIPLMVEDGCVGVLVFLSRARGAFDAATVQALNHFASRLAVSLRNASRVAPQASGFDVDVLKRRVDDLSLLQDIAAELPSVPVLSDTAAAIGRRLRREVADLDLCLFFVHHPGTETLVMVGGDWNESLGLDQHALTVGISEKVPLAETFQGHQPMSYESAGSTDVWQRDPFVSGFQVQHLMYTPLAVDDEGYLGVLAMGSLKPQGLDANAKRLAELISKQGSIMIERARLYEKLRSANEKLEQINSLKNEFISMVSHELRTPLTTIKGFVTIVMNEETGPINDQQRHFLQTSDRAIDRLTLLVSDLLDISRIEAGQIKMQLRATSVREVMHRLATSFSPEMKSHALTMTLTLPDQLPPVMADPERLGQVLDNLVSNAIRFTPKGGSITLSAFDKGDFVVMSVKDTGSGIPKEEQERIFEKFYQIKSSHAWPGKGTGLGLAIVRSIVESHHGKVWVESEPGKGADFKIIFPRARTEVQGASSPPNGL